MLPKVMSGADHDRTQNLDKESKDSRDPAHARIDFKEQQWVLDQLIKGIERCCRAGMALLPRMLMVRSLVL